MVKPSRRYKRIVLSLLFAGLAAIASAACATIQQAQATPVHAAAYPLAIKNNLTLIHPAWHPTRDFLAATGWEPCWHRCPTTIYGIDMAEGKISRLVEGFGQQHPAFTADGKQLSFTWSTTEASGTFLSDLERFDPIFFHDGGVNSWSPDGKHAALTGRDYDKNTAKSRSRIHVIDLDTQAETPVFQTPWSMGPSIKGISWSSDSKRLAFGASWYTGGSEVDDYIYMVNRDGSQLRALIEGLDRVRDPGWLPDGEWLFFVYGKEHRLAFQHVENGCIVNTDITDVEFPTISGDGRRLAYSLRGRIFFIDLDRLLGPGFEALRCP